MLNLRYEKVILRYLETHKRYFFGLKTVFFQTLYSVLREIRFNPYEIRVKQTSENSEQLKIRKVTDDYFFYAINLSFNRIGGD